MRFYVSTFYELIGASRVFTHSLPKLYSSRVCSFSFGLKVAFGAHLFTRKSEVCPVLDK